MYPLENIYGPLAYRRFDRDKEFNVSLKGTRGSSDQVNADEPLIATSYTQLVDLVSFLSIMNKRHTLYFRGQTEDWPLHPAIFRSSWTSLSGTRHSIPGNALALQKIWDELNGPVSSVVLSVCDKLPMPRRATLRMFREAIWAVAQHYELWPTPLIDITPSLRVAASFALWGGHSSGYLYVVALPPSTNSVTFDADQHIVLARLQAVCPPLAKRPHYQDGFLAGRFPFMSPASNQIDSDPAKVSNLARRLVARIILEDTDDVSSGRREQAPNEPFWTKDFPKMSVPSLMPQQDRLLDGFSPYAGQIDEMMHRICHG